MIKRVTILLILFATCFAFTLSAQSQPQKKAKIVGWNIFGVTAIPKKRIKNIAETIRRINPDIIVLTEVNPNDVPQQIVEELGSEYQAPVILTQKETTVQNIAFLFKTTVSVSNPILVEGTDLSEEPRSRKALSANVKIGNFDFILIGVHLKSSRDVKSRSQRSRQARAIADFISNEVSENERDILVVGDYNMIPPSDNDQEDYLNFVAMSPTNYLRFISSDFLIGQTSHIRKCNPLDGNLLDGFAISRVYTTEYVAGSTRILSFPELGRSCASFLSNVSDHRPLISEFRINNDDD